MMNILKIAFFLFQNKNMLLYQLVEPEALKKHIDSGMYLLKEIQDYKRRILPDLILKIYSSAEFIIYSRYVGFLT